MKTKPIFLLRTRRALRRERRYQFAVEPICPGGRLVEAADHVHEVDLPDPDGPITATKSPSSTDNDTRRARSRSHHRLVKPRKMIVSISGIPVLFALPWSEPEPRPALRRRRAGLA